MRALLTMFAIAAAAAPLATLAACGDPPSCEKSAAKVAEIYETHELTPLIEQCHRENWSDSMRSCIKAATSKATLDRCRPARDPLSYMKKSKKSQAEVGLNAIEHILKARWAEDAALPVGHVGPTPDAGSCCDHAPDRKCPADPALWQDPIWQSLDFEMEEPAFFSFEYESDGKTATARAIGDLDCDTTLVTYELRCAAVEGNLTCDLTRPVNMD